MGPSLYYVSNGTGWVGFEKWQFLLTFSTFNADVGWVSGSEIVQKCADVIWGWSLCKKKADAQWMKFAKYFLTRS